MNKPQDIDAALLPVISSTEGSLTQRVHQSLKQAILALNTYAHDDDRNCHAYRNASSSR